MHSERLKTNAEQQAKQETRDHETRKLKKEQAKLVAAHEQQMQRIERQLEQAEAARQDEKRRGQRKAAQAKQQLIEQDEQAREREAQARAEAEALEARIRQREARDKADEDMRRKRAAAQEQAAYNRTAAQEQAAYDQKVAEAEDAKEDALYLEQQLEDTEAALQRAEEAAKAKEEEARVKAQEQKEELQRTVEAAQKMKAELDAVRKARKGHEKYWKEMQKSECDAVRELGWTPTGWDQGDEGPLGPHWEELSDEQHRAAELLGYDHKDFDRTTKKEEKKKEENRRVRERSLKHWSKRCWRRALMAWKSAALVLKHEARQLKLNGQIDELALARALETWKGWVSIKKATGWVESLREELQQAGEQQQQQQAADKAQHRAKEASLLTEQKAAKEELAALKTGLLTQQEAAEADLAALRLDLRTQQDAATAAVTALKTDLLAKKNELLASSKARKDTDKLRRRYVEGIRALGTAQSPIRTGSPLSIGDEERASPEPAPVSTSPSRPRAASPQKKASPKLRLSPQPRSPLRSSSPPTAMRASSPEPAGQVRRPTPTHSFRVGSPERRGGHSPEVHLHVHLDKEELEAQLVPKSPEIAVDVRVVDREFEEEGYSSYSDCSDDGSQGEEEEGDVALEESVSQMGRVEGSMFNELEKIEVVRALSAWHHHVAKLSRKDLSGEGWEQDSLASERRHYLVRNGLVTPLSCSDSEDEDEVPYSAGESPGDYGGHSAEPRTGAHTAADEVGGGDDTPAHEKYWKDMREQERQAFQALGWTSKGWDDGDQSPMRVAWESLSADQRAAAERVGFGHKDFKYEPEPVPSDGTRPTEPEPQTDGTRPTEPEPEPAGWVNGWDDINTAAELSPTISRPVAKVQAVHASSPELSPEEVAAKLAAARGELADALGGDK